MITPDRLALVRAFEDAGLNHSKAEAVAGMIMDRIHDKLATKGDLVDELRRAMKTDLGLVEQRLAVRIDFVDQKLGASIDLVERQLGARVDVIERRLLIRVGALVVVVAGILFVLLRLWPPHG